MKLRGLCLVLFWFLVPAAALEALPPEPEPTGCPYVCDTNGGSCDEPCTNGFRSYITCGQYRGAPANDLDSDGVANTGDNCLCIANTNQANCDGDSQGDACDFQNEKWVLVADRGVCDFDTDAHLYYWTAEVYGLKQYQNVCNGSICYDRYLAGSANCNYSPSGCGSGGIECCDCKFPGLCYPLCANYSPSCPF